MISLFKNRAFNWIINTFHNPSTSWIILILSISLTIAATLISFNYSTNIAKTRFDSQVKEITRLIKLRMNSYKVTLLGGAGLFDAKGEISRRDFYNYTETLKIDENLPGIQGIGYCIPLKDDHEADSVVQKIRSAGFPDFSIKPEGKRDEYTAIIYLEPFNWRNQRAFGYDMWSNKTRRDAMTQARKSGKATISGMITLVQETNKNVQRGFLMYVPVYNRTMPLNTPYERQAAFKGWIYSPFRAGDFMGEILNEENFEHGMELYNGDTLNENELLFCSDSICHLINKNHSPDFMHTVNIQLLGRTWTLYFYSKPGILRKNEGALSFFIGVSGVVIDIIIFLILVSLHKLQTTTQKLAQDLHVEKSNLETANKELEQFAYITSHDLQEPLRTIHNYAVILNEDYEAKFDKEGKYCLSNILKGSQRMSEQIQAILEYSRLDKKMKYDEVINLNELLSEIKHDLEILIRENNTNVIYGELPTLTGNRTMLKQLFSNILSNAIKYRKQNTSPIITIGATQHSSFVRFRISDNGIGINKKYHEKIFEIFQRLHNKSEYSGTGIGLSLCKKIVELHHGSIQVESEENKGSTFIFTISKDYRNEKNSELHSAGG